MVANKVIVKIKAELLSIDALAGLLQKLIDEIRDEFEEGHLQADDGDYIEWETERQPVEF